MKKSDIKKRVVAYSVLALGTALFFVCHHNTQERQRVQWEKNQSVQAAKFDRSLSGNYLAARFAVSIDDLKSASYFYNHSLDATKDKDYLVQRALPAAIGAGDIEEALRLTKDIDLKQPSLNAQLGVMVLLIDAFKREDVKKVSELLPLIREDGFGRLLSPLLQVWSLLLENKEDEALARLDAMEKEYPTVKALVNSQKAIVYEISKDEEKAAAYYTKSIDENVSLRAAWMLGQYYERHGQTEKAQASYKQLLEKAPDMSLLQKSLLRLEKGDLDPNNAKQSVKDGVASSMYDVASVLFQESSPRMAVLYAQLSYYLSPKDPFVNLLLGDIFASSMVRDSAVDFYNAIDEKNDLYILAQLRLANLYETTGQSDNTLAILQKLRKDPIVKRQATMEIADMYRRQENFAEAIPYYDEVIASIKKPKESDWAIYYARAICLEREGKLEKSEADLKQSLALSPDQPEVLNYLAYTWADHGKNLEKALDMLMRALAGSPQDPYITDSVGWALFRLQRFEEAIPYFETAVQGLPDDVTVNDHLGDAYWRVGRRLEAEFQWRRALKGISANDEKMRQAVREKLKNGLPVSSVSENKKKDLNG